MFPELLQLTTLDDYKERVTDLLVTLTDSGYVKPSVYESSLSAFIIDARVAMKKRGKMKRRFRKPIRKLQMEIQNPKEITATTIKILPCLVLCFACSFLLRIISRCSDIFGRS